MRIALPVTAFHTPTVPSVSAAVSTLPDALTAASIGALGCLTSSGGRPASGCHR